VNLNRVQSVQPYFRGKHVLVLQNGTTVAMSRSRRKTLERAIGWRL
jgi:DNA-binding LytR/AlgR family response regulator